MLWNLVATMIIVVFVLCFLVKGNVDGQVVQFGTCPSVKTVTLFDVERFLGTWYEIERFPAWYEHRGNCAYKRVQSCGRIIEFQHVYVKDDIEYILHMNSTYNPGDEAVFEVEANSIDPLGIPLSVVATDYHNYAILYGCRVSPILNIKYTLAWILSRSITLNPEELEAARRTLTTIPYTSTSYLEEVRQDPVACDYQWTAHIHAVDANGGDD